MAKPPAGKAFHKLLVRTIQGVKAAPFPGFVPACQPLLRKVLPEGERWQYEIKLDGYRVQIHWRNREARAYTRKQVDYTAEFAPICTAAAQLPADAAILDGEVIVQNAAGVPDFHALRRAIAREPGRLLFYAFDLLYLDGYDLRSAALAERRRILAELLAGLPGTRIHMSETIEGAAGAELLRHACSLGIEGIVAKRIDAPYRSGDVESWIKVKCVKTLELPIIGYVPAAGRSIAALRLARRDGADLVYAGKVGTGFSVRTAQTVRERLEPLMRKTPPLAKPLRKKDTVWVEPTLSAKVELLEMTEDGQVRHASFKGLV